MISHFGECVSQSQGHMLVAVAIISQPLSHREREEAARVCHSTGCEWVVRGPRGESGVYFRLRI